MTEDLGKGQASVPARPPQACGRISIVRSHRRPCIVCAFLQFVYARITRDLVGVLLFPSTSAVKRRSPLAPIATTHSKKRAALATTLSWSAPKEHAAVLRPLGLQLQQGNTTVPAKLTWAHPAHSSKGSRAHMLQPPRAPGPTRQQRTAGHPPGPCTGPFLKAPRFPLSRQATWPPNPWSCSTNSTLPARRRSPAPRQVEVLRGPCRHQHHSQRHAA